MDKSIQENMQALWSQDRERQNQAFEFMLAAADKPVDWAYEIWDEVVAYLADKDNHNRAIAAQVLCSLAKSDPDARIQKDFKALLAVTRDDRFVTARHCLQALWKVGAAGVLQEKLFLEGLALRYQECSAEKNCTLIRYDIVQSLRNLYDAIGDEGVKTMALGLIEVETDEKYKKKYAGVWKSA